jgi:hypothetical protein
MTRLLETSYILGTRNVINPAFGLAQKGFCLTGIVGYPGRQSGRIVKQRHIPEELSYQPHRVEKLIADSV